MTSTQVGTHGLTERAIVEDNLALLKHQPVSGWCPLIPYLRVL
jgi:hypothetical protein